MLTRICLFIAIIAGLLVVGIDFTQVRTKVTKLQDDLSQTKTDLASTQTKLSSTERDLTKTRNDLKQTKDTLASTTTERDQAVTKAQEQTKRADQLAAELTKTKTERDDAQAQLAAFKATGFSPEQVMSLGKTLKDTRDMLTGVQGENKLLGEKLKEVQNELAVYRTPDYVVPLPANLAGKILVSDPKWNFVVLNVGRDQGVLKYGELLVNRDGRLVAKVRVTNVEKDRCVANVVPGWRLGEPMEGDQVIPAHPAS